LKLRDPKAFVASREKLAAGVGGKLESLTLDGRTYRYLHGRVGELGREPFRDADSDPMVMASYIAASTFGQSWTIEGDMLFVADMPHTLADYFDVIKQGSIVDTPEWAAAVAYWPQGGQALGYSDPRAYFSGGYNLFVRVLKMLEGIAREAGVPVDINRLPRAQAIVRHLAPGINAVTLDNEGLALETRATMGGIDETLVVAAAGGIVAAIAIPNLIEARKSANEAAAIGSLRTLVTAQALFQASDMDGDGAMNYAPSLDVLAERGLIDPVLGGSVKQGYVFTLERGDDGFTFKARAEPMEPGETGQRYFFVDESGVIRFNYWEPANEESYPLGG
jgi:hypothetical protein